MDARRRSSFVAVVPDDDAGSITGLPLATGRQVRRILCLHRAPLNGAVWTDDEELAGLRDGSSRLLFQVRGTQATTLWLVHVVCSLESAGGDARVEGENTTVNWLATTKFLLTQTRNGLVKPSKPLALKTYSIRSWLFRLRARVII